MKKIYKKKKLVRTVMIKKQIYEDDESDDS